MAKRQASLLNFCQSTHKRQRESEEKSDDQNIESNDSDRQDAHIEDSPEESEHGSEHSCHDPSHTMSPLSPQIFGDLLAAGNSKSLNNHVLSDCFVFVFCFKCDFHSS